MSIEIHFCFLSYSPFSSFQSLTSQHTGDRPFASQTSLDTLEGSSSRDTSLTAQAPDTDPDSQKQNPDQNHGKNHNKQGHDQGRTDQHGQSHCYDESCRIEAERADSDMPMHADALITAAHLRRRQTYADIEHPLEDCDDDAGEEEYAEEMAYLLAQVSVV